MKKSLSLPLLLVAGHSHPRRARGQRSDRYGPAAPESDRRFSRIVQAASTIASPHTTRYYYTERVATSSTKNVLKVCSLPFPCPVNLDKAVVGPEKGFHDTEEQLTYSLVAGSLKLPFRFAF